MYVYSGLIIISTNDMILHAIKHKVDKIKEAGT